ncbi:hypothetical protein D0A40_04040 [Xanthomonas campestris pv. raphani]|nr:hypothetical protein D0A40_04040 [Xanthomonas campestris pv. raphani]
MVFASLHGGAACKSHRAQARSYAVRCIGVAGGNAAGVASAPRRALVPRCRRSKGHAQLCGAVANAAPRRAAVRRYRSLALQERLAADGSKN